MSSAGRKLIPLFDRVLIRKIQQQARTSSGIILPEKTAQMNEGIVVEVGTGARDRNGNVIAPTVKQGDHVLLPEYGSSSVKANGEEYQIYRESDLIAIVKE